MSGGKVRDLANPPPTQKIASVSMRRRRCHHRHRCHRRRRPESRRCTSPWVLCRR